MSAVLILDAEPTIVELYDSWLKRAGHPVVSASAPQEARKILATERVDVLVADIDLIGHSAGKDLLASARQVNPAAMLILLTSVPSMDNAVVALQTNAYDYLVKPINESALLRSVARAAAHSRLLQEKLRSEEEIRCYRQLLEELVEELARIGEARDDLMGEEKESSLERIQATAAAIAERCQRLERRARQIPGA